MSKPVVIRHRRTGTTGIVAWRTETEIGIDCGGFTWTGTIEQFETLWERT